MPATLRLTLEVFFNAVITHVPVRRLRHWWLELLGARIGEGAVVFRGTTVRAPEALTLGERAIVGWRCVLDSRGGLEIGHDTVIASDARVLTADHNVHSGDFEVRYGPIAIADHCWVATGAIVLRGVSVAPGGVVAAGAVAAADVPADTVVGGIPASRIAERPESLSYRLQGAPRLF